MNRLRPSDLVELPITDPVHVANEINWIREYREVNGREKKRRKDYMIRYEMKVYERERERDLGRRKDTPAR